jgi:hypothetical protein
VAHIGPLDRSSPGVDAGSAIIRRLIGGRVAQPVHFDGNSVPRDATTLPLYTRAADRIEAAVGVNLGRAIDVSG